MILPGGDGISFMMLSAVTDLPQPDSPTTPRVSPFSMYRSTPSTARTIPSSVKKYVLRFLTSNRRSAIWCGLPLPGLRNLAERVEGAVDVLPVHVLVGHAPDGAGPDLVDLDLAGQAAGGELGPPAVGVHVEDDDVGLDLARVEPHPRHPGEAAGQARRVGVVLFPPIHPLFYPNPTP